MSGRLPFADGEVLGVVSGRFTFAAEEALGVASAPVALADDVLGVESVPMGRLPLAAGEVRGVAAWTAASMWTPAFGISHSLFCFG